jgi:hypothetical protein
MPDNKTISVPANVAAYLEKIAQATPETLRILAGKCDGKTPAQMQALETKLKTYQAFI